VTAEPHADRMCNKLLRLARHFTTDDSHVATRKTHTSSSSSSQSSSFEMSSKCACFKSLFGSKLFNQILLLAINGLVLVGGIVMVYFAASKRISSPTSTFLCTGGSSSVLTDPLVLVISFGSLILIIAALGMIGACCRSSKYRFPSCVCDSSAFLTD
jgi:hypothetical protein